VSVAIRLRREGSSKRPRYRVVVTDSRSPRDGRFIEVLGRYNPQTDPSTIDLDEERVRNWLARGAQPSGTVKRLLKVKGISG
jgi:small subunit ribosomal protein S16